MLTFILICLALWLCLFAVMVAWALCWTAVDVVQKTPGNMRAAWAEICAWWREPPSGEQWK